MASMSSGKLQVLRKLSLVTLTGYMERHCPTHRSGWNWELPKFIKKIKTPDYKGKFCTSVLHMHYNTIQKLNHLYFADNQIKKFSVFHWCFNCNELAKFYPYQFRLQ